jgi:putative endonuclease
MRKNPTGRLGEDIASKCLKDKGHQILDRNYEYRISGSPLKGEIDLIVKKSDTVSFIEIKTLRQYPSRSFLPEEKVDFRKKKKITKAAISWLMKNRIALDIKWQIDIIGIRLLSQVKKAKISHLKNVFCQS